MGLGTFEDLAERADKIKNKKAKYIENIKNEQRSKYLD